jgi:hypothetical protein
LKHWNNDRKTTTVNSVLQDWQETVTGWHRGRVDISEVP